MLSRVTFLAGAFLACFGLLSPSAGCGSARTNVGGRWVIDMSKSTGPSGVPLSSVVKDTLVEFDDDGVVRVSGGGTLMHGTYSVSGSEIRIRPTRSEAPAWYGLFTGELVSSEPIVWHLISRNMFEIRVIGRPGSTFVFRKDE